MVITNDAFPRFVAEKCAFNDPVDGIFANVPTLTIPWNYFFFFFFYCSFFRKKKERGFSTNLMALLNSFQLFKVLSELRARIKFDCY